MKKRIYYFSGTGNSMRAARVIANKLGETEIISMRMNPDEVPASDCDVIGFVYPVYHCANCMACVVNCPKRAIGYEISDGEKELLNASNRKTPIVKIMGLPKKRKLYRNPYISAKDLTKERE